MPVQDHFHLIKTNFKSGDFDGKVSFSGKCVLNILFPVTSLTKGFFSMGLRSGTYA